MFQIKKTEAQRGHTQSEGGRSENQHSHSSLLGDQPSPSACDAAWNSLHSIGIHCATMHGIHCVQFKSIAPHHTAWNPLHSNEIHWATLHGIHCSQSGSIVPHCRETTAFNRQPLLQAAWNPLHSIGIHWASLHGIHCVQSTSIGPRCMESTAFYWDPFRHASWNTP